MNKYILILSFFAFFGCQNTAYRSLAQSDAFDEVYGNNGTDGEVRAVYRGVINLYNSLSQQQKEELLMKKIPASLKDSSLNSFKLTQSGLTGTILGI